MARNRVQFQKGLSEPEFERPYGTEEQCRAAGRGIALAEPVRVSGVRRDAAQRRQNARTLSVQRLPGADFADRRNDLRLDQVDTARMVPGPLSSDPDQAGDLQHRAWSTSRGDADHRLDDQAQTQARSCSSATVTSSCRGASRSTMLNVGGERAGGKRGRGAAGKTPFVAAVETTQEGKPVRLKLRRVAGFRSASIAAFAKQSFDATCAVVSDGLACFAAVTAARCSHEIIKTGSGPRAAKTPAFKSVNTALGKYQGCDHRHLSLDQHQTRATIPCRVRIPLQQAL